MRRVFWLGVGATIGVLVVRKVTRTAESFTPRGVSAGLAGLGDAVRDFAADVRTAMDEHERELLSALGVDSDGTPPRPVDSPSATARHRSEPEPS